MRTITKDIQILIDGNPQGFRLTKPDAFSGVEILRLLLRLQGEPSATAGGGCFAGGEVNRSKRAPQCGVAPTEVAESDGPESPVPSGPPSPPAHCVSPEKGKDRYCFSVFSCRGYLGGRRACCCMNGTAGSAGGRRISPRLRPGRFPR